MSAPPPYQNQPQQPYGYQQPPQQPYGYQQAPPQQQYGHPQPPRGPQRPQRPQPTLKHRLIGILVVLPLAAGAAWYMYDYNTNPHSGRHAEEAAASASAEAYEKKHVPKAGDCVKITGPDDNPEVTIVGCDSAEAQYKYGKTVYGGESCGAQYTTSITTTGRHTHYTRCFTKV
ncbi:LppU/SCO3897 family protein [Streptomyces chattanoogensis]|uniref:LppU/SCO3897 family protein n=1 Tax=Streptomyces chattanoogensis TaxID=66876 RepID=UPI0005D97B3E|nr:hypothetical protein T261_3319 [Streptomyces lydicus]